MGKQGIVRLNVTYSYPVIRVIVIDIEGKALEGIAVNFVVLYDKYGNLTLNPWSATTDEGGVVSATVISRNGTIRVVSGKLPPVDIATGWVQFPCASFTVIKTSIV